MRSGPQADVQTRPRRPVVATVFALAGVALAALTAPAGAQRAVTKGEVCELTCPKSACRKTCAAGTECVTYCSPNDYAICKCVKPDTRKRPR